MSWLWFALAPFVLAIATYVVWTILGEMHAHSVYLYGRAVARGPAAGAIRVRFAIQNGEDVPLCSTDADVWRLQIGIEDGARFVRNPLVYAGPRPMVGGGGEGESSFWFDFAQLGASDTWVIECDVERQARAMSLRLVELRSGQVVSRRLRRLSASLLRVDLGRGLDSEAEVRGSTFLPSAAFGFSSIGAVVLIYAGSVLIFGSDDPAAPVTSFHPLDVPILASLALLGAAIFRFVQRPAPPLIQGFQEETEVTLSSIAPPPIASDTGSRS
jgi:hypothetical protein